MVSGVIRLLFQKGQEAQGLILDTTLQGTTQNTSHQTGERKIIELKSALKKGKLVSCQEGNRMSAYLALINHWFL